jgi:hypothetical protein
MKNKTKLPTRPNYPEQKWVDFDESTNCWGVFGVDSGFCYSTHSSESEANKRLNES